MIKKELMKNPQLKNENWERFLPKFERKTLSKRKKPKKVREKKAYTPFPPAQPESKMDKEMATGEYFLKDKEKRRKKAEERREKQNQAQKDRNEKRKRPFIAPKEDDQPKAKKAAKSDSVNPEALAKKLNKMKKKSK